jgi:cysteinyl-tRNA synthetase
MSAMPCLHWCSTSCGAHLEYRGYTVKQVMNYTDVDDKIINRAKQLGEDPLELSQRYIEDYTSDLKNLNILPATSYPQVSKTMPLIIEFIQGLIRKEAAYAASNGDVYFSVTGDEDYGKLSGRKIDDMQAAPASKLERRRITRWTSPSGRLPNPVRSPGTVPGARDARLAYRMLGDEPC